MFVMGCSVCGSIKMCRDTYLNVVCCCCSYVCGNHIFGVNFISIFCV